MREIKFRAWDIQSEKWIDLSELVLLFEENVWSIDDPFNDDFETMWEDEDFIMCQFTGLKDKNGVDIFEGDLILWDGDVFEVQYQSGEWILFNGGDPEWDRPSLTRVIKPSGSNVEVKGNIYVNKELLS